MTSISLYVGDKERGSKSFELSALGSDVIAFAKSIITEYNENPSLILKHHANENGEGVVWYKAQSLAEFLDSLNEKKCKHSEKLLKIHVSLPRKREPAERSFSVEAPREKRINSGKVERINIVRGFHTAQDENAKLVKFPILQPLPYPQLSQCEYDKESENDLFLRIANLNGQFKTFSVHFQALAQRIATRIEIYYTSLIENIDIPVELLVESLALPDANGLPENAKLLRSVFHLASGLETAIDSKWELSLDSIQQIHGDIMRTDSASLPGVFRPNSIGGVAGWQAPHASKISQLMENLIAFHNGSKYSMILTGVICHLHFEMIHPFNDGNGRIGRVLFYHSLAKLCDSPADTASILVLFVSMEIMKDRSGYYQCLSECQNDGKIQKYIDWFLGIISRSVTNSLAFLERLKKEMEKMPHFEDAVENEMASKLKANGAIAMSSISLELGGCLQRLREDGIISSLQANQEEYVVLAFLPALLREYCKH